MDNMKSMISRMKLNPPATQTAIDQAEKTTSVTLPHSYHDFLKISNGGEGFIHQGAYIQLWEVEELGKRNEMYRVAEFAPGLLLFGTDGGGEAFGFDCRVAEYPIVEIPISGLDWIDAIVIANTFTEYLIAMSTRKM